VGEWNVGSDALSSQSDSLTAPGDLIYVAGCPVPDPLEKSSARGGVGEGRGCTEEGSSHPITSRQPGVGLDENAHGARGQSKDKAPPRTSENSPSTHFESKGKKTQRSLPPCLSEPFAGVMRRTRGLSEADSWFEGSCAPRLTPRTDSSFLSCAASPPQPHRNPLQIAFQPIYRRFSSFEGSRLVV
jgi:hypothetical protein